MVHPYALTLGTEPPRMELKGRDGPEKTLSCMKPTQYICHRTVMKRTQSAHFTHGNIHWRTFPK